jgi:hypothetical protein
MPTLPALLKKLQALHRQHVEVERDIVSVESEIVAASRAPKPRAKRATNAEIVEVVRATVKVLRDAGGPLPRREIASRLGISPSAAAYRLKLAIKGQFIESLGGGRYRATNIVPAF